MPIHATSCPMASVLALGGVRASASVLALGVAASGCGCPPPQQAAAPPSRRDPPVATVPLAHRRAPAPAAAVDAAAERAAIDEVVDGWHAAASRADEQAYFAALTEDAIFLGTDATERWDKAAFRAYAHPHFAKGKAWSFRAARRNVILADDGTLAWFDEDLVTPNLGPARGSGVLRKEEGVWRIAHYNLAITVPNERFGEVKALLERPPE